MGKMPCMGVTTPPKKTLGWHEVWQPGSPGSLVVARSPRTDIDGIIGALPSLGSEPVGLVRQSMGLLEAVVAEQGVPSLGYTDCLTRTTP